MNPRLRPGSPIPSRTATLIALGLLCMVSLLAAPAGSEPNTGITTSTRGPQTGPHPPSAFDAGKAAFQVRVHGEHVPYRVFATYVLPGQAVDIEVVRPKQTAFRLDTRSAGNLSNPAPTRWAWTAPRKTGLYPLAVVRGDGERVDLNVFVMVPRSEVVDGALRGYVIGDYPEHPLRGLPVYLPPGGFVEVSPDLLDTRLSPHFTLGQFLCKQAGGYPKFVTLRERLLLKLEYLLQRVNARGIRTDTFAILSGFRTPAYNHAIGNVRYSRHQWGGAADIFIDVNPVDGRMDDLDGNGRIDGRDADLLYDLIDGQVGHSEYEPLIGGLGKYGPTSNHGPFVHVDARGFKARWGR